MNTATSSDNEFDQPQGTRTPPVLAKVPWLRPRAADAEPTATQTPADLADALPQGQTSDQTPLDESLFRPHSVVAAADLGVEPWDTPATAKPAGESVRRELRIDPPQPLVVNETPEATAEPAEATSTNASPEQTPPVRKSIYRETPTASNTVVQPAAQKTSAERTTAEKSAVTTLRFDPPETATDDSLPEPQTAPPLTAEPMTTPSPQTAYASGAAPAISAERLRVTVPRSLEPSTWHTWVSKIDDSIRQYHRVIVLAALLTAAGLMMLVLENQQQPTQPAPESVTPAAAKTSADDGSAAVENSVQPLAKATTEANAAAENATSMVQSEQSAPALSDTAPAGEVVAAPTEGPLAGEAEPMVPFNEFVSNEQVTNEPGQLATAKGPRAAKPHPAVTTTQPLQPHRELHAASPATAEASSTTTTAFHSTYQSTGAPEIVLPGYSAGGVRTSVPRTARLSGEVHSVPPQATR